MELQKLGISYQFERSGQLPLDNSRKFSTYNEVKSWWTTVGNFYETQIISIGNILYYFYSLPESANTALDANLETHLHKLIDDVTLAANKIDTTEIDASTTRAINAAKKVINTSIIDLDTSLRIYAQNADASILSILDLIDVDTLGKIDTIETRIDNITALLENTDLGLLTKLDASIKDLINVSTLHDTSIRLINTSLNNYANIVDASIITINYDVSTLAKTLQTVSNSNVGRLGTGEHSEIFNDYTNNVASGNYSHAEGANTKAQGSYSFAGGYNTNARGDYSFAFGNESKAESDYGIALGYKSKAVSRNSIAIGTQNTANGEKSTALGYYLTTYNEGEIALGVNNYSEIDTVIFSIGNGDPIGAKRNILTVTNSNNYNLFIQGIGNYNGANPFANDTIKSIQEVITGLTNKDTNIENHINSSYLEVSAYIHSSYLVWNSSTSQPSSTKALNQTGAHLLYTYLTNLDTSLLDLSTNTSKRFNEDETNIYNKILEVSTNLLNTGKRIDTSLISTNSSVGKLEASTNILERYVINSIDPSIRYIKDHDSRIDSSVKIINTSINKNEKDISTLKGFASATDTSIKTLNSSVNGLDTSIKELQTDLRELTFTADDLHALQYVEQPLSERQKRQARANINAASDDEYAQKFEEINILYEMQKMHIKHIFIDEQDYANLHSYTPNALYMVIGNNTMITVPKPANRTINVETLNGNPCAVPTSNNYTVVGSGGTAIGTYRFMVYLKDGRRWNDYTIDPIIVTYTVTGEEVFTWQFGDSLPIVLG